MAKIPIEDSKGEVGQAPEAPETSSARDAEACEPGDGEVAAAAGGDEDAPAAVGATGDVEGAGDSEAAEGATEDPVEDAAGNADGSAGANEGAPDGDLIAEAEAIVEEASASEQLEAARTEASEWQGRYLRLHAEWDTYRRRMGEQRAEEKARATEGLMEDLLPVLDDFERTVAYASENGEEGLLDGVKAVQTKLLGVLSKGGLVTIDPAGEPYDALEAQAVATVPDDEAYDETVREVYQKGYKMGKKVLRAAMVTVTTGGPKRPDPEESEEA